MQRCHYNASLPLLLSVDLPQYVIDLKYTYTGDIAEFIQKEAPLPPLLIAHSFGGLIVQQYISCLQGMLLQRFLRFNFPVAMTILCMFLFHLNWFSIIQRIKSFSYIYMLMLHPNLFSNGFLAYLHLDQNQQANWSTLAYLGNFILTL